MSKLPHLSFLLQAFTQPTQSLNLLTTRLKKASAIFYWFVLYLVSLSFIFSCQNRIDSEAHDGSATTISYPSRALDLTSSYRINPVTGDSTQPILNSLEEPIVTGNPITITGHENTSLWQSPQIFPARWENIRNTMHLTKTKIPGVKGSARLLLDTLAIPSDVVTNQSLQTAIPLPLKGRKVIAQHPQPISALPPLLRYDSQVNLKSYNLDQGLNSESVTDIIQDQKGNIWISYWGGGISKFDGRSFWHYTEREGLVTNLIWKMIEDQDGQIWMGTHCCGLIVFDGNSFTQYDVETGLPDNEVLNLFNDHNGNIWLTGKGTISKYDGGNFTHYGTKEGLVTGKINRLQEDSEQKIWIVSITKNASVYNGQSFSNFKIKHSDNNNNLELILIDRSGNWWLSDREELLKYDGKTITRFPVNFNPLRITYAEQHANDHIWFTDTGGQLLKYDGNSLFHYKIMEEFNTIEIKKVLIDKESNVWIALYGGGLYLLREESFFNIRAEEGLLMIDDDQNFWFGHPEGLRKYDGSSLKQLYDPKGSHINIRTILEDHLGHIWIGTSDGRISKYDGQNLSYYNQIMKQGFNYKYVNCIIEDRSSNIWFGMTEGNVIKYDGTTFTRFSEKDGLPPYNIITMYEDNQGNLWFGTAGGGLIKYDGQSFVIYSEKEGLSSNHIVNILEDRKGIYWLGTLGKGVINFDGKRFTYFTSKEGLSHDVVCSLTLDEKDNLWVATEKGLNLLTSSFPEVEQKGTEINNNSFRIFKFDRNDGILNISFNWNANYKDKNKNIWLSHTTGHVGFDPAQFQLAQQAPLAQLDDIQINGKFVDYRNFKPTKNQDLSFKKVPAFYNYPLDLRLAYKNNHLNFHFTAVDWYAPHKIRYSYKMDGYQDYWSAAGTDTKAEFRNLPQGHFTFRVRAMGATQQWGDPFSYSFTIYPPWWASWWAYSFYALVFFGIIYSLYRFQLNRQLEKQERTRLIELDEYKTRLYTNITHEFRTPLTIITGMAEQIKKAPDQWAEKGARMIKQNSNSLLNLVNQILELRKLDSKELQLNMIQGDIVKYLNYLVEPYQSYAKNKDVELHFLAATPTITMDYDSDKILRIVSNLLSNAVKYTPPGGHVYFHVDQKTSSTTNRKNSFLHLRVQDTGTGIPVSELPYIFDRFYQVDNAITRKGEGTGIGLALTRELVTLFGGKISVSSVSTNDQPEEKTGTTFLVQLPITNKALVKGGAIDKKAKVTEQLAPGIIDRSMEIPKPAEVNTDEVLPIIAPPQSSTILLIEDNADIRQYLMACLQDDYHLLTASNGQEGINEAIEQVPDLIISDVMMPIKDGYEVCTTLKEDERTSHIPIVLLTAKADLDSKISGLRKGADAYLTKPFEQKELVAHVDNLLLQRKKLQERYTFQSGMENKQSIPALQIEDEFIQRVKKIIHENIEIEDFGILSLCRSLGMSRTQLHNKIKALTGKSTSIFIRFIRLQKGHELLKSTDLSISEIAYQVGFRYPANFTKFYTQEFGESPTQTRK